MTVNSKPPVIVSRTSESPLVLERTSKGEKNFPWSLVPSRHERRAAQVQPGAQRHQNILTGGSV